MQSENGILLLFYIFLSHGNKKKNEKEGVGCKKGDAVSCPQVPVSGMCACLPQHPRLFIFSLRGHDRQSSEQNNRKLIILHNNGEDDKHAHGFADF